MTNSLPLRVADAITRFAEECGVRQVILFGSRARGTNGPRSDVDIAVRGGDFDASYWAVKERMPSLLLFDIVSLDSGISAELQREIDKDGVTIYEKAG